MAATILRSSRRPQSRHCSSRRPLSPPAAAAAAPRWCTLGRHSGARHVFQGQTEVVGVRMSLSRLLTVVDVVEVWTAAFPTANGKCARPTAPPLPPPPALTSQTRAFQRAQPRNHSSYLSPALRDPCSTGHSIPHERCSSSGGQASLEPCSKSFSKFPPFEWTFRARSSAHNVSDP